MWDYRLIAPKTRNLAVFNAIDPAAEFTAESLSMKGLSIATVYRVLSLMREKNMIAVSRTTPNGKKGGPHVKVYRVVP